MTYDPKNPTKHAYVAPMVARWRTCQVCGHGANSSLHKPEVGDGGGPTDEALDAISDALTDTPQTPSTLGRTAHVTTTAAAAALRWLVANRMAVPVGNGAWTKYRARQFGEVVR